MSQKEERLPFTIRNLDKNKEDKRSKSSKSSSNIHEDGDRTKSNNSEFLENQRTLPDFDNSDLGDPSTIINTGGSFSSFSSSDGEDSDECDLRASIVSTSQEKPKTKPPSSGQFGKLDWTNISKDHISGPIDMKITSERRTKVNRTKFLENGKTVPKKWSNAFLVLIGPKIFLYKNKKDSLPKPNMPDGKPEVLLNISDLEVFQATSKHTSKANTLCIQSSRSPDSAIGYLLNFSKPVECQSWEYALNYSKQLNEEKRFTQLHRASSVVSSASDQTSIVNFLKEFFRSRTSREQLIERGIIKNEPVFGSSLEEICEFEKNEVPTFVCRLIKAIELRGLNSPGIYRMSGNSAKIQALRIEVDHYKYNLNSEKWDFDVLTGALKLFFRELKVPLFSNVIFKSVSKLFHGNPIKFEEIIRVLQTMPSCHFKTAQVLFHHLYRIIEDPDNKMRADNLAIVFGPTLLHNSEFTVKEKAYDDIAKQNKFIELLLIHTPMIFGIPVDPPVHNFLPPQPLS